LFMNSPLLWKSSKSSPYWCIISTVANLPHTIYLKTKYSIVYSPLCIYTLFLHFLIICECQILLPTYIHIYTHTSTKSKIYCILEQFISKHLWSWCQFILVHFYFTISQCTILF
jgi:hypothetical protein